MNPEEIKKAATEIGDWYHSIEITPGWFTPSNFAKSAFPQWDQVRAVRAGLDYKAKRVLDLGTMDGMWAFEAEKLGAKEIYAGDIWQSNPKGKDRFKIAQEALCSQVKLLADCDVHFLVRRCKQFGFFDIIQCLGLLYHLENPLLALHNIAAMLAPGGVVLVETAVYPTTSTEPFCRFNGDLGVYYDRTTVWAPNWSCLLGMLHRCGLVVAGKASVLYQRVHRVCFVAQRNANPLADNFGLT